MAAADRPHWHCRCADDQLLQTVIGIRRPGAAIARHRDGPVAIVIGVATGASEGVPTVPGEKLTRQRHY